MLSQLGKLHNFSQCGNIINSTRNSSYAFSATPWLFRNSNVEKNQQLFGIFTSQTRYYSEKTSSPSGNYLPREYWGSMDYAERERRRNAGEAIPITGKEKKYRYWANLNATIKARTARIKEKMRAEGIPKLTAEEAKKKKEERKKKIAETKEKYAKMKEENEKRIQTLTEEKPEDWEKQVEKLKNWDPKKERMERKKLKRIALNNQRKKSQLQGVILFKKPAKKNLTFKEIEEARYKPSLFDYVDPQKWKKSPVPDESRINWKVDEFEDDSYEFYSLEDDRPPIDILRLIPEEEKRIHFYRTLVIRTGKECTKFIKMVKNLDLRKLSREEQDAIFSRKEAVEKQIEKFEEDRQLFLMSDHIFEAMDEITIPQFDPVINPELKENLYQTWVQSPNRWTLEKLAQKFRLKKLRGLLLYY